MLTKESNDEGRQRRTITVSFYLAVSTVLLISFMLATGAMVLSATNNLEKSPRRTVTDWAENSGWISGGGTRIREAVLKWPGRYVSAMRTANELPTLVIDIKFQNQEILRRKRDAALKLGVLIQDEGDLVPATVRLNDKRVRVRLRLKGDLPDHYDSDKWSMRVEVRDDDHILGMRRFSLQHPKVRSYQAEPLFMETLRNSGVIAVRYQFVNVVINGESKGIMALEEHFSKELVESQDRREGVIVRFDETNFWDYQRAGGHWLGGPYNSFRNSRIKTFRPGKVAESPVLSQQYEAAVGLLRAFASKRLTASRVFDVETTASYLAALELWGAWHSIQWNDIRFYLNPLSMQLEPIGYDANLRLHSDIREITLKREPIFTAMLQDEAIRNEYLDRIRTLCRKVVDGGFGQELEALQNSLLPVLRTEYWLLEPMELSTLVERAQFLLDLDDEEILQRPATNLRRIYYPALVQANLIHTPEASYIELGNYLAEPVTITSIRWRDLETGVIEAVDTTERTSFPIELPATVLRGVPEFTRLQLRDYRPESTREMVLTAKYANWPQETEFRPVSYFPAAKGSPVPESQFELQLETHPFLEKGEDESTMFIRPGHWTVAEDIVIPSGVTLSAGPSTTLDFVADSVLVTRGDLQFIGSDIAPVILRSANDEPWQGIAVLQASNRSNLKHVEISNTSGVARGTWQLTGGVTFYRSDVDIQDVRIADHSGEDALNIVNANFDIQRLTVAGTQSDAFDADFTTGIIRQSVFADIGSGAFGADAIDVSGSRVEVADITFNRVGDKALSVGESSRVQAAKLVVNEAGTAIASKDGSYLEVSDVEINAVTFAGLMAYSKKSEYGPASIKAYNINFKPTGPVGRVQTGSSIELEGDLLPSEELDVDKLYETVMRKGP